MPLHAPETEPHHLKPPFMRNRRQVLALACLAVGGALWGVALLAGEEPTGQVQDLPGGARLELRGWTFGPDHTFIDGDHWHRLLLRGGDAFATLGGYRGRHQDMGNDLVLWFRGDETTFSGRDVTTAWIDPHGCRISSGWPWAEALPHWALCSVRQVFWERSDIQPPEQRWIDAPRITPRRGQSPLQYAIVERGRPEPLARFTVPGVPRVSTDTAGTPSALPARVTTGDTTFVLKSLRHEAAGRYPLSRSAVAFRYEGQGPHSRSWRPVRVVCEDGTGNELVTPLPDAAPEAAGLFETLCRRDPAWKLVVRFARPDPRRVPPDAVRVVADLPAPRPDEELELTRSCFAAGVGIGFESIRGSARGKSTSPGPVWDWAVLQLNVAAPEGGQIRLLRATDQQGRELFPSRRWKFDHVWDLSRNAGSGDTPILWPVVYPPGTRKLNLTFGIHRTRTAEFIVKP